MSDQTFTTRVHMCLSVRGALKNWSRKELGNMFTRDDGSHLTADEARDALMDELAKGHEVIPIGDCDNFDFKTGCKGHRIESLPT